MSKRHLTLSQDLEFSVEKVICLGIMIGFAPNLVKTRSFQMNDENVQHVLTFGFSAIYFMIA